MSKVYSPSILGDILASKITRRYVARNTGATSQIWLNLPGKGNSHGKTDS